ncbi:hypothetical protein [Niameybacter massiliensis]|uniref:hypothetical protein n=1 Tax=Niameybacter massiliensis TaxID=1658108 RepID=UPI0006B45422|nr:hypothetical protein [Niameybacter massiliensis]
MEDRELLGIIQLNVDEGIKQYGTQYLLGTQELSEDLYEECKLYVKQRLPRVAAGNTICITQSSLLVTYTLVQFAIKEYRGGQYLQEFYASLGFYEDLGPTIYKAICASIASCMRINKLYFHRTTAKNMYMTTLLVHALLPQYTMEKLYELLGDIYYKDLEEDYIEAEVEELFNYLSKVFRYYIDMDDMTFTIEGKKMTIANQQLPKGFRLAWIQSPEIIEALFKRLLRYIDNIHYDREISYGEEDRFDKAFEQWRLKLRDRDVEGRSSRSLTVKGKKKFTKAQYQLNNDVLKLVIPRQIIDIEHIGEAIQLELYNEKQSIERYPLEVSGRICFKTEEIKIEIKKFEPYLGYKIYSGDNMLYDSRTLLHRDYLLFNEMGEEITGKQVGEERLTVIAGVDDIIETDDVDTFKQEKLGYIIHTMYLNENSYVYIGDKMLTTSSANEKSSLQSQYKCLGAYIEYAGEVYSIYCNRPRLKVRVPYKVKVDDIILKINDKYYNLEDIGKIEIRKLFDGSGDQVVDVHFNHNIVITGKLNNLVVRIKGSNLRLLQEKFIIIEAFTYTFEKKLYYDEQEATLLSMEGKDLTFDGAYKLPDTFSILREGTKQLDIYVGMTKYVLYVKVPRLEWQLGNKCSRDKNSYLIWHEDLESAKQLIINAPIKPTMALLITDECTYTLEGRSTSGGYNYAVQNEFQAHTRGKITLGLIYEGEKYTLTNIFYQPALESFNIRYYAYSNILKGLQCFWNFLGKGEIWIDIIYSKTNQIIKTYKVTDGKPIYDPTLELYFGKHQVVIYQLIEDEFFEEESEKIILLEETFIVGDVFLSKTNKHTLKVVRCLGDDDAVYDVPNFYLKNIGFDRKTQLYTGDGCFQTSAYTGEKLLFMTHYNPLSIEVTDMESLRLRILDKNGETLIYDKQTGHINPKEKPNQYDRYVLIEEVETIIYK